MSRNRSILSLGLPKEAVSLLAAAGYETQKDLANVTAEGLIKDFNFSDEMARQIVGLREPLTMSAALPASTQSAAALAQLTDKIPTGCSGLDNLLKGGIQRGHILELSGPPGSPKDLVVMNVIQRVLKLGDQVIIVDCQNMMNRRRLLELAQYAQRNANVTRQMKYSRIQTAPQFMLFMEQLPTLLGSPSKDTLLVLSSISFPFQSPELSPANKTALLQKLKQTLAKLTAAHRLTVVATTQLATKMVNSDGSLGTFETGALGVMVPHLGSAYLPSGRSWRVIFSPNSQTSGLVRLLSSTQSQANGEAVEEAYSIFRRAHAAS